MSRWGGNAVTAYNQFGGFTNAGNDWYFENRGSDSADDWIGWVSGAGSASMLTVPAYVATTLPLTTYSPIFKGLTGCQKIIGRTLIPRPSIQVGSSVRGFKCVGRLFD
jgi:hypothetical protein